MAIVRFYVMRHGEKDSDDLTAGLEFTWAFCSGMNRALQTVEEVLYALGHEMVLGGIKAEEGFSYVGTEAEFPIGDCKKVMDVRARRGEDIVVLDWLKEWTGAAIMRGRVQMTLLHIARELASCMKMQSKFNILVGSHSPTGELACLEPSTTPTLREADICLYEVEVPEIHPAKIVSSTILRAPY